MLGFSKLSDRWQEKFNPRANDAFQIRHNVSDLNAKLNKSYNLYLLRFERSRILRNQHPFSRSWINLTLVSCQNIPRRSIATSVCPSISLPFTHYHQRRYSFHNIPLLRTWFKCHRYFSMHRDYPDNHWSRIIRSRDVHSNAFSQYLPSRIVIFGVHCFYCDRRKVTLQKVEKNGNETRLTATLL